MTKPTIQEFMTQVERYVGTPYRHAGRDWTGVDCVGLLAASARDVGISFEDQDHYPRLGFGLIMMENLTRYMVQVPIEERKPGDWGVFWFDRHTRAAQHIGMFVTMETGAEGMIHSYSSVKKVVKHHLNDKWLRRLIGVLRIPDELVVRN